ncbi:hypothetical protein EDB83DRAFT_2555386 [Lactarius deliciosus]|nr:hypothetical protein EDB83DRAFT_2555386 [Lactarius deliciosus]
MMRAGPNQDRKLATAQGVDGRTGTRGRLSRMGSGVNATLLEGSDRASWLKTKLLVCRRNNGNLKNGRVGVVIPRIATSLDPWGYHGAYEPRRRGGRRGSLWNVVTAEKPSGVNEPNELRAVTVYALGFPGVPFLSVVLPPPPANLKFISHFSQTSRFQRLTLLAASITSHKKSRFGHQTVVLQSRAVAVYYAQRHTPAYMGNDNERGIQGTKRTYGHRSVVAQHVFVVTPSSLDEYLGWV